MNNHSWQLPDPIEAISFDCDSTLSSIEGIDELAKFNSCESEVNQLTEEREAYVEEVVSHLTQELQKQNIEGWHKYYEDDEFYYIKNFSPWIDLLIVARTVRIVITGFGSK